MANATLPSAQVRFTSEFGMGSGGSTPLLPPGKPVEKMGSVSVSDIAPGIKRQKLTLTPFLLSEDLVKNGIVSKGVLWQRFLVLYDQAARAISTG